MDNGDRHTTCAFTKNHQIVHKWYVIYASVKLYSSNLAPKKSKNLKMQEVRKIITIIYNVLSGYYNVPKHFTHLKKAYSGGILSKEFFEPPMA